VKRWSLLLALLTVGWSVADVRASHSEAHTVLDRGLSDLERASSTGVADPATVATVISYLRQEPSIGIEQWLLSPLESAQPDVGIARERFKRALDLWGTQNGPIDVTAEHRALDDILARPPFQTRDIKSSVPDWLLPLILLVEWLAEGIGNIARWPFDRLGDVFRAFVNGPAFLPFISLAALTAVMSLILLYRRGLRSALVAESVLEHAPSPLPPTSAQAIERAQRFASNGRYREACHFMFLSALLWIEEHGQTRFERSATNWEHLERLDEHSPVAPHLRGLINRFDRLWYGQPEVSAADYRDLEELALKVRQAVT
jgi:hypothetical protein